MRVDEIRREMVLAAPIEKVWAALTTADELSSWFGDSAEIDLRPGGRARFGWSEFQSTTDAIVEIVEAPHRFSFRWDALKDTPVEEVSTMVEFTLESVDEGTRLTLVESGFATLPEDSYEHRIGENTSGWTAELADLDRYLSGVGALG